MMSAARRLALGAAVVAAVGLGQGVDAACSTDRQMELVTLPTAKCHDGSPAMYFVDAPVPPRINPDFVLWLGHSELCGSKEECDKLCNSAVEDADGCETLCDNSGADPKDCIDPDSLNITSANYACYEKRLQCSSELWDSLEAKPESILCGDPDSPFRRSMRVYVPACTYDWFLGNGDLDSDSVFQGAKVLDEVVQSLLARGLGDAEQVVLGGTKGGGVAALHAVSRVRAALAAANPGQTRDVRLVTDSAFLVPSRYFGVDDYSLSTEQLTREFDLQNASARWVHNATFTPECAAAWGAADSLYKCLFAENVLVAGGFEEQPVLVLQSQFDLDELVTLGVTKTQTSKTAEDELLYSQSVLSFLRAYGTTQRDTIKRVSDALLNVTSLTSNLYFFSTACTHVRYILPISAEAEAPNEIAVGDAGSIRVQVLGDEWKSVSIGSAEQTVKWAVEKFASTENDLPNLLVDRCAEFLCNDACPSELKDSPLEFQTSGCLQSMVVVYCLLFIGLGILLFLATLVRVCIFRVRSKRYWQKKLGEVSDTGANMQKQILRDAAAGTKGRALQLMVENLNYWAPAKSRNGQPFQILRNVSLNFRSGSVSALMGPSGSGKSTLLDVLSYTRESGRVTGTHYINGVPSHLSRAAFLREWVRNSVSYVRQQDLLFPRLTVREHLEHSAWLMLPQFMPTEKKLHRVWQVIKLLELESCADTICGDGGVRVEGGISGGQRRRVSVATQLLNFPAALLLDEPTSGLDSTNALLLVECLKNLAEKSGVTIVMTIHQPRKEIFRLLDSLSILVRGRVVFSGSPDEAASTFGVDINEANVGDEILDKLQGVSSEEVDRYRSRYESGPLGRAVLDAIDSEKTELTSEMAVALRSILVENALAEGRWSWTEATSTITTMWVLMSRVIARGGFDIWRTIPFSLVGGLLVGLVFLKEPTYTSQTALAYLGVSTMTFLQSTFLGDRYNAEKQMWSHERDNGTNINWLSFLICLFLRNIMSSTLEGLAFAVPIFFMGQLRYTFEIFVNYLLLMTLTSIAVIVQNTTVEIDRIRRGGDAGPDTRQAVLINMSLLALSALFNGFIIQLSDIPVYLKWIPYIMLTFWSFVGVLLNNFKGYKLEVDATPLEAAQRTGDNWIRSFDYDSFDVYQCMLALLVLIVGLHIVSVIDFYFRFAHSSSSLTRGRPRNAAAAGKGEDEITASLGTPRLTNADSGRGMKGLMNSPGSNRSLNSEESARAREGVATGSRGRVLTALLSREVLASFFLFDLALAWKICFFSPGEGVSSSDSSFSDLANRTSSISTDQSSLDIRDNVSPIYVVLSIVFFGVYVVQFLNQVCFLVPLSGSGRRTSLVWISIFDLGSIVCLVADAGLLLVLFTVGYGDSFMELILLAGIHFARYGFVVSYWFKVNSFHRSRSAQIQRLAGGGATEDEDQGDHFRASADKDGGATVSAPHSFIAPSALRAGNRVSAMFSRAPPPPPPSRGASNSQRFRDLDLGPQWRAFQQPTYDIADDEV